MPDGLRLELTCDACGRHTTVRTGLTLTRLGTLRVQGGTQYYVDGGRVLCPDHRPDPVPYPQTEATWSEVDLRHALNEIDEWNADVKRFVRGELD